MACTAEQIARKVGCSIATVSRVLNNSAPVSAHARSAVLDAVREAGGVPRVLGRRTARSRSSVMPVELASKNANPFHSESMHPAADLVEILMLVRYNRPTITVGDRGDIAIDHAHQIHATSFFSPGGRYSNSYYRHIVDGAISELKRVGMRAVLQVTDTLTSPSLVEEVNRPTNGGLVVLGDYFDELPSFFQKIKCPVVSLVTWRHHGWPDYVGIDNQLGIRQAFEHVYELGHRKIGYLSGSVNSTGVFAERLSAFQMCLADVGLLTDSQAWIARGHSDIDSLESAATKLLTLEDRPTAILCCYDGAAIAVKRAADKLQLRIPHDLSVVGFDDEEIGQLFSPPLTTVHVPSSQMGRLAIQALQIRRALGRQNTEACSTRVMPSLVKRQSTAPMPRAKDHRSIV